MNRPIDYKICVASAPAVLEKDVVSLLNKHWQLWGGPFQFAPQIVGQAMVLMEASQTEPAVQEQAGR